MEHDQSISEEVINSQTTQDIDPFLVDDDEDDDDTGSHEAGPSSQDLPPGESTQSLISSAAVDVSLRSPSKQDAALPPIQSELSSYPQSPQRISRSYINKDVPPPPPSHSDSEDEAAPALQLPGLTMPSMFLPIPNTDPLTTLLSKHVPDAQMRPRRDTTGEWQNSDFHTLVMTNNWRALARMARDRLVATTGGDVSVLLDLWYLRLSSLARMRLFNQTSAECSNLFSVLNAVDPPAVRTNFFDSLLPFELEVLRARCLYWAGDFMTYLDELSALLRRCKSKSRISKDPNEVAMWKERAARMCLIIASQLTEMKEYAAATSLLDQLCKAESATPALRSAIARIHLQSGNLVQAERQISLVAEDPTADADLNEMNALLLSAAYGDWSRTAQHADRLLKMDSKNVMASNNLAVALLSQGRLKDGIELLENVLQTSPETAAVLEPFLFNLSTLHELRAGLSMNKKQDLLIEVARWSGDGLRTTCLKMPSN